MTKIQNIITFWIDAFFIGIVFYVICQYLPYRIEHFTNLHKVHAHRANTLTKLQQAHWYYEGVELDVYYDEITDTFDIFHPPAQSIGLSLEEYLSKITDKKLKIWLDFKNLTEANKIPARAKLNALLSKFQLKKQMFLVESKHIIHLQYFKANGFKTSYYVPSDLYQSNLCYKDSIYNLIARYNKQSISFTHHNYNELHHKFPLRHKYVWALFGHPLGKTRLKQMHSTRQILKDSTVKRLLVPFKSIGGNR
ncbi:MAG: hypothetical protein ACPGU9_04365 [Flavobacteriaceae bacterium]